MVATADTDGGNAKRPIPWVLGGSFILLFLVRDYLVTDHGVIGHSAYWGRDFINVWTGGDLVREGRFDILYNLSAYADYQRGLFGEIDRHNYSYPPVTFPIASLLSLLPYWAALAVWTVGTASLFVWAARPWWPKRAGPAWFAILTPAAIVNIWAGHYGFLLGTLYLLGWRKLDESPRLAGIYFGLMLIKPHLAVLIPLALLIRRKWEAFAWATATITALVAVTTAVYGWEAWHAFLFRTSGVQLGLIDAQHSFFGLMSTSPITAVLAIGGSWAVAIAVYIAIASATLLMVVKAATSRVSTRELAFLVATATFLVLPYSFNYDLTVVMIGALWLLTREQLDTGDQRLAMYGFLAPQFGMVLAGLGLPMMPLMLFGLAYVQFRLAMSDAGSEEPRALADGAPLRVFN